MVRVVRVSVIGGQPFMTENTEAPALIARVLELVAERAVAKGKPHSVATKKNYAATLKTLLSVSSAATPAELFKREPSELAVLLGRSRSPRSVLQAIDSGREMYAAFVGEQGTLYQAWTHERQVARVAAQNEPHADATKAKKRKTIAVDALGNFLGVVETDEEDHEASAPASDEAAPGSEPSSSKYLRPSREQLARELAALSADPGSNKYCYAAVQLLGPPLRVADFVGLRFMEAYDPAVTDKNYFYFDEEDIAIAQLNQHKTARHLGPRMVVFNTAVSQAIKASLKARPRSFLLSSETDPEFEGIAKWIASSKRSPEPVYGCNIYRRNMADELLAGELDVAVAQFSKAAKYIETHAEALHVTAAKMGSSAATLCTEYRKRAGEQWSVAGRSALHALLARPQQQAQAQPPQQP